VKNHQPRLRARVFDVEHHREPEIAASALANDASCKMIAISHCERRHSTVTQYECLFATQTNSGPPPLTIESARR
jgi:hypothetical protein